MIMTINEQSISTQFQMMKTKIQYKKKDHEICNMQQVLDGLIDPGRSSSTEGTDNHKQQGSQVANH